MTVDFKTREVLQNKKRNTRKNVLVLLNLDSFKWCISATPLRGPGIRPKNLFACGSKYKFEFVRSFPCPSFCERVRLQTCDPRTRTVRAYDPIQLIEAHAERVDTGPAINSFSNLENF